MISWTEQNASPSFPATRNSPSSLAAATVAELPVAALLKDGALQCSSPSMAEALDTRLGVRQPDLVMLFMNDHALNSLLGDKFKLGTDASVAAGRVGRNATAGTDLRLNAEILSYSRSKGIFAGVSLDGAVVQADKSGDRALYGDDVNRHEILSGKISVPPSARELIHELHAYSEIASRR